MSGPLRLLRLMAPHWRRVLLGGALSLATLAANVGLLALSSWFIASMAIAGVTGASVAYALPAAGVRAFALLRAAGRYAERLVNHDTTLRILAGLRVWFFERLEPLMPARLDLDRAGDLLSRVRADIDLLDDFYVRGVVPALVAAAACTGFVVFLARFDPLLAAVDAASLAVCGVLLPLLLRRLGDRAAGRAVACAAALRASVVEDVQGMAELIAFGAGEAHEERARAASRELDSAQRRLASLQGAGDAGTAAIAALAVCAAAWMPGHHRAIAPADVAMLVAFVMATFEAVATLRPAIQRGGEIAAASRRLFEIIDAAPPVTEPAPCGTARVAATAPDLAVSGLRFRYGPDRPWVLDGLSFEAPYGAHLAVSGPSGSGKSSLVAVLLRFREYEGGSVTIGGVELRSLKSEAARELFSVVPQVPHLFRASVRDNLLIAAPDGTEADLWRALETAQIDDFVASLPDGLDTLVGERGTELSVGQARRIAVARALLRPAPICLLDEPTEGLDDPTADRLLSAVSQRLRDRTLLVISHRDRDRAFAQDCVDLGS